VTYTVIGLCALMFVLQLATGGAWTNRLAFWPAIGAVEPYRFLTASFLHSTSFMGHILFNMLAFWQCGQLLERAFGHWRFLAVCFVSALGGSVGFLLLSGGPGSTGWVTPVVGASGMVFGLFGALIPVLKTTGNSIRQILVLIAINGVLGFVVPGIAWQAHLGGLIMGIVVSLGYTKAAVKFQQIGAWALPLAATILLIGVGFIYYEATGWLPLLRFVAGA
jgi:membrane associated rhomboid family serine protease